MRSARNYAYKHSGLIISHNISDNVINKHRKINERNCDLQNTPVLTLRRRADFLSARNPRILFLDNLDVALEAL